MKAGLFDLDNTLFDVEQYYSGAFRVVAEFIEESQGCSAEMVFTTLMRIWKEKTSMYPHLFDDLNNEFAIEADIQDVVGIFNSYSGPLSLFSDVKPLLTKLKKEGIKLGIITDGTVSRQKRKIKLLSLDGLFDVKIFTNDIGENKLTPIPFLKALAVIEVDAKDTFFVGDNPSLDFKGAKGLGVTTIRYLRGEFKGAPRNKYIDHEISELSNIIGLLL